MLYLKREDDNGGEVLIMFLPVSTFSLLIRGYGETNSIGLGVGRRAMRIPVLSQC